MSTDNSNKFNNNKLLDHHSMIPLYYQLKEIVSINIKSGQFREGEALPSENELQKQYGISRATIRKCFDLLANEGLIEKKRGKGTFVKHSVYEEDLSELKSFTEKMKGMDAKKQVLIVKYINPPRKIKDILKLFAKERVLYLKRLMIVGGIPIGIREEYIPERVGFSLEEDYSKSVYEIFKKYGIILKGAEQTIEASFSTKEETATVGLKKPFPTLLINRTVYSTSDEPVEYLKVIFNANRYRYHLKLIRYDS